MGLFDLFRSKKKNKDDKYKLGMHKTRENSFGSIKKILAAKKTIDDELFDELEEVFIMADVGVDTVIKFVDDLRDEVGKRGMTDPLQLQEVIIDKNINTTQLFVKLQEVGKELLLKLLPDLLNNNIKGIAQDETKATYSFNIKREEEKIDFNKSVFEVHNLIRGLAEVPGAYCMFKDKEFKIYSSEVYKLIDDNCPIGSIKIEGKNNFLVKCKDGYLKINEIKIEGKQKMDVKAFLNGCNKEELVKEVLS